MGLVAMAMTVMHEKMHQRASQQYQIGQPLHQMLAMFHYQQVAKDGNGAKGNESTAARPE
jgi:hypothetical protein